MLSPRRRNVVEPLPTLHLPLRFLRDQFYLDPQFGLSASSTPRVYDDDDLDISAHTYMSEPLQFDLQSSNNNNNNDEHHRPCFHHRCTTPPHHHHTKSSILREEHALLRELAALEADDGPADVNAREVFERPTLAVDHEMLRPTRATRLREEHQRTQRCRDEKAAVRRPAAPRGDDDQRARCTRSSRLLEERIRQLQQQRSEMEVMATATPPKHHRRTPRASSNEVVVRTTKSVEALRAFVKDKRDTQHVREEEERALVAAALHVRRTLSLQRRCAPKQTKTSQLRSARFSRARADDHPHASRGVDEPRRGSASIHFFCEAAPPSAEVAGLVESEVSFVVDDQPTSQHSSFTFDEDPPAEMCPAPIQRLTTAPKSSSVDQPPPVSSPAGEASAASSITATPSGPRSTTDDVELMPEPAHDETRLPTSPRSLWIASGMDASIHSSEGGTSSTYRRYQAFFAYTTRMLYRRYFSTWMRAVLHEEVAPTRRTAPSENHRRLHNFSCRLSDDPFINREVPQLQRSAPAPSTSNPDRGDGGAPRRVCFAAEVEQPHKLAMDMAHSDSDSSSYDGEQW